MQRALYLSAAAGLIFLLFSSMALSIWGFWGHRRINRLAVFTLPPKLIPFYKKHIEYLTEHAVDADKRRYATRHEGVRHYIDLDEWGEWPFLELPRKWTEALMAKTEIGVVGPIGDTSVFKMKNSLNDSLLLVSQGDTFLVRAFEYKQFFYRQILPQYYEEEWRLDCDSLTTFWGEKLLCREVFANDRLSEHGILPYHLVKMQDRLTRAFESGDVDRILQFSADMGHYIGDAHVPLHTTKNYNGQLTGQEGIHAFWESRLPELFADAGYDYFVGRAVYIEDPEQYYWNIVLESHRLVDSVLTIEKSLQADFPESQQFCFEERNGLTVRTQCSAYAQAFHERLNGMVERRMRAAIRAVGSAWLTAWVDAGQPDLLKLEAQLEVGASSANPVPLENSAGWDTRGHE